MLLILSYVGCASAFHIAQLHIAQYVKTEKGIHLGKSREG